MTSQQTMSVRDIYAAIATKRGVSKAAVKKSLRTSIKVAIAENTDTYNEIFNGQKRIATPDFIRCTAANLNFILTQN